MSLERGEGGVSLKRERKRLPLLLSVLLDVLVERSLLKSARLSKEVEAELEPPSWDSEASGTLSAFTLPSSS